MTGKQKVRIGRVVGDKMDKTVVVSVETRRQHRLYRRTIRSWRRYKVHDEDNACQRGDMVRIVETRPLSKEKRWRVAEILSHRELAELPPEEVSVPDSETAPAESAAAPEATP